MNYDEYANDSPLLSLSQEACLDFLNSTTLFPNLQIFIYVP